MIVVGLDLSLTCTGIVRLNGSEVRVDRVLSAPPMEATRQKRPPTLGERFLRLSEIAAKACETIGMPDLVVVEQPAFSQNSGSHHDRSGLWWIVMERLMVYGVDVAEVSPTGLKKFATGKGNASKTAVVDAVARRWPEVETDGDDNVADALVLAKMGVFHLGENKEDLPKAHLASLDAVRWPG